MKLNTDATASDLLLGLIPASGKTRTSPAGAFLTFAALSLLVTTALPVLAQDSTATPAVGLEEVVVTARRQVESLSKVPASVTAITPQQIDAQGLRTITDLTRVTPGLAVTYPPQTNDVSGSAQTISVRGIASQVGSPTTGIYIDDTPIQARGGRNAYPQLFDLERVEMLRGPQGTLFGAGAEGGAVRFITPRPDLQEFSGNSRAELAFTQNGSPTYEAGGVLTGPIMQDKLGFRASAWYREDGGYIDEVSELTGETAEDENTLTTYVLRGAMTWQTSEHFSASLALMYQDEKLDDNSSFYMPLSDVESNDFKSARRFSSPSEDDFMLSSLDLNYESDTFDVISTTSFFTRDSESYQDYTHYISSVLTGNSYLFLPDEFAAALITGDQEIWTQEVRIQANSGEKLNWVVGGFYGHAEQAAYQRNDDPYVNAFLARLGAGPLPLLPGDHGLISNIETMDEQIALFGQVDYEWVPGLKVTAGVRVAEVESRQSRVSTGPIAGGAADYTSNTTETPVTPKIGLSYEPNEDTLLYLSAAKGYRIGGINGPQLAFCDDTLAELGLTATPESYESDSLWSYEGGVKARLLDGRVSIAASVFDIDWSDIQQQVNLAACRGSFIVNVGQARSTGFDLAADFRITSNLKIGMNVGYADARLTQDFNGPSTPSGDPTYFARSGDKVGGPPLTGALSGEFDQPISGDRSIHARLDYQYVGQGPAYDFEVFGLDPLARRSDSYNQVALRAGLRMRGMDISAFVNNLLNETPILSSQRGSVVPTDDRFVATSIRPRTFGVTMTYQF